MPLTLRWLPARGRAVWRRRVPVRRLRARPERALADQVPGGLGGLLLGFLLGPALPAAVGPAADPHRGPERLLVVGAALLDVVVRDAEGLGGGELLQGGLPVKARAEPGRPGDDRVEQPVHQGVRRG